MTTNLRSPGQAVQRLYLERDQSGDAVFLVEGRRIRAHRSILAEISPKYKAQFYGPNHDDGEIHVVDVPAAAFEVFLQFFYKETIDLTMDNIEAVLDLVQQSLVKTFNAICVKFLSKQIPTTDAIGITSITKLANVYNKKSIDLGYVITQTSEVLSSDDFLQWDRSMLLFILKMDTLNCTEIEMFNACISWARAECERINLDPNKPENLRTALGDAIYEIRFASFSCAEFAESHHSVGEGFFTTEESIEVFYMTNNVESGKPKMFNQTRRSFGCEPDVRTVPWSHEIDRFIKLKKLTTKIKLSGRCTFSFTCRRPIRLHGFALGIKFKKTNPSYFPMNVTVGAEGVPVKPKLKVFRTERKNETIIIFEQPFEKVSRFSASIVLQFKQLNYEFDLKSIVPGNPEVDTGFEFLGGSVDKWVTRIFYEE